MALALLFYLVLIGVGAMVDYAGYYDMEGPGKPRRFITIKWTLLFRIFVTWPVKGLLTIAEGFFPY
jgi:hypothetical protein